MNTPRDQLGAVLPPREPKPAPQPAPEMPEDASSQALSDALRSSFAIIRVLMIGLVAYFLCSGIRSVGPQEKAIRLRFGKPAGAGDQALLGPGLHWAFPYPIDELVRIPIGQVQSVTSTIGWYAVTPAQEAKGQEPPPGESLDPAADGYVLTADGNIIHVRGTLRYRIREPGLRYTFDFVNASNLVLNAFNNALVYAAAHYRVDDVLTRDFAGFQELVRSRMDQLVAQQGLGIIVDQVDLKPIAPRKLRENFDAVAQAALKREQLLNQARSYANQTTNRARAEAAARINIGESDRKRLVEMVAADAKRFSDLLPDYRRNPDLFLLQQQTEVLQRVLTNAQEKIVLPTRADGQPRELRLQLSREPQKVKPLEPPKAEH